MIELYNGDCLKILDEFIQKKIKVDCIITDPPYGIDFKSNYRIVKHEKIENDIDLNWLDNFIEKINLVLNDNTHGYIFCSFHNIDKFKNSIEKVFNLKNILIWEKNNTSMGDLLGDYAPKYEMIIFFHKGRRDLKNGRPANILKFNRANNEFHPTQKPVDLIEFLIENSTDINEKILDCFMGSGATGIACKKTGRKFIGIEINKKYFNICKKRLENTLEGKQQTLF